MLNKIYNEECLEGMKRIPDRSVDMVLCDLPYGTTDAEWDNIIPYDKLWEQYERIVRPNGWIILTASNPFSASLIMSNRQGYSHQWIWDKQVTGNPLLAKLQPLKTFEDVLCFNNNKFNSNDYAKAHPLRGYAKRILNYIGKTQAEVKQDFIKLYPQTKGTQAQHFLGYNTLQFGLPSEQTYNDLCDLYYINGMPGCRKYADLKAEQDSFKRTNSRTYNPQMIKGKMRKENGKKLITPLFGVTKGTETKYTDMRYPKAIIQFKRESGLHPTQKPTALFEYLIKTYTNEGETVLDNCMGSGTTAIACMNTNRNFIGFELDEGYWRLANERIEKHKMIKHP